MAGTNLPASCAPSGDKVPAAVVKALSLRYDDEYDRVVGCTVRGTITDAERLAAIRTLEAREAERLEDGTIRDMLGRIRLMCAGQKLGQADLTATVNAYAQALGQQPAYAVRSVLMDWPDRHQWWPSYAEISGAIDNACSKYRQTLKALREYEPGRPIVRTRATPERRAEAIRKVGDIVASLPNPYAARPPGKGLPKVDRDAWAARRQGVGT